MYIALFYLWGIYIYNRQQYNFLGYLYQLEYKYYKQTKHIDHVQFTVLSYKHYLYVCKQFTKYDNTDCWYITIMHILIHFLQYLSMTCPALQQTSKTVQLYRIKSVHEVNICNAPFHKKNSIASPFCPFLLVLVINLSQTGSQLPIVLSRSQSPNPLY